MKRIANAARQLLKRMDISVDDAPDGPNDMEVEDLLAAVWEGGRIDDEDPVSEATAAIGRLVEILDAVVAARALHRAATKAVDATSSIGELMVLKGHQGDDRLNDWTASLIGIYQKITGRRPGTSVGFTGTGGGPLVRFLVAASRPLGIKETSPDAWRNRARRILKFGPERK